PMRLSTRETRTEDDVGEAVENRFQKQIVLFRIVLEIGILNYHEIAGSSLDAGAERRPLAPIGVVLEIRDRQIRMTLSVLKDHLFGIIRGSIVDDYDFLFCAGDQADLPHLLAYA